MADVTIFLEGHPPGGNRRRRAHWQELHRSDKQWAGDAALAARKAVGGGSKHAMARVILTVTHCFPQKRQRDWDNLASSLKGILDGLKGVVIVDDNTDCILELHQAIEVGRGRDGVQIELVSMGDSLGL